MPRSTGDWHYKFGPSSLKGLKLCPSSRKLARMVKMPYSDSFASVEGTYCHEAVETENLRMLIEPECREELTELAKRDGKTYNKRVIQEEIDICKKCLNWIEELKKMGQNPKVIKEALVFLHSIDGCTSTKEKASEHLITAGSMDGLIIFDDGRAIGFDHKMGRWEVEAKGNIQGLAYCSAIMEMFPEINEITFYILQPRTSNKKGKGDTYYREKLDEYRAYLKKITDRADSKTIVLNPGRDQCFFCTAKGICPAYKLYFDEHVEDKRSVLQFFGNTLSDEEIMKCVTIDTEKLINMSAEVEYSNPVDGIRSIKDAKKVIKKSIEPWLKKKGRR